MSSNDNARITISEDIDSRVPPVIPPLTSSQAERNEATYAGLSSENAEGPDYDQELLQLGDELKELSNFIATTDSDEDLGINISQNDRESVIDRPDKQHATTTSEKEKTPTVLALHVLARGSTRFQGDKLAKALNTIGMEYGEMKIFHFPFVEKNSGAYMFSLANMLEPGSFDIETIHEMNTPGVVLFMQLDPGSDNMVIFDKMLDKALSLATSLDGNVCDETRSVLTEQGTEAIREKIRAYKLKSYIQAGA